MAMGPAAHKVTIFLRAWGARSARKTTAALNLIPTTVKSDFATATALLCPGLGGNQHHG
jgi:hypothetical protein